ncbi:hypothetical protein BCB68_05280 [Leptotrichia sp. oral taxon 498]|uniref:hypothetical protein n=1 Tax=Leptotrichia sp. oral taxon 498 TaxID=712368 RepID=UPI000B8CF32C|nr:hypothetical protein [Leptotrichia sp. oral taxon 498]ASQ48391.1 hypothetical protein BCB68_05280 [Leptotrichia sp. oral taxon 498]
MVDKAKIFLQLFIEEMIPETGQWYEKIEKDGTKLVINDEVAEEIANDPEYSDRLYDVFTKELEKILKEYPEKWFLNEYR